MPSLRHHRPAGPAPLAPATDLAHELLREAARLRGIAASCDADDIRDALIDLAGQCDAAAAVVLRHRRGAGARIAPAA